MRAGSPREPWFGEGRQFIAIRPPAHRGIARPDDANPPRQRCPYPCRNKPSVVRFLREAAASIPLDVRHHATLGGVCSRTIPATRTSPTEEGGGRSWIAGGELPRSCRRRRRRLHFDSLPEFAASPDCFAGNQIASSVSNSTSKEIEQPPAEPGAAALVRGCGGWIAASAISFASRRSSAR
jgi:hypothetical protein